MPIDEENGFICGEFSKSIVILLTHNVFGLNTKCVPFPIFEMKTTRENEAEYDLAV